MGDKYVVVIVVYVDLKVILDKKKKVEGIELFEFVKLNIVSVDKEKVKVSNFDIEGKLDILVKIKGEKELVEKKGKKFINKYQVLDIIFIVE